MYWAAERRGGKVVAATDATKGRAYRCPNPRCNAEVFLRSGRRRADHFAHMPGQGKLECEDFHVSDDLSRSLPAAAPVREAKHVDPLELSIELEPEAELKAPRKWKLRLTIPKAPDTHGQIAIDLRSNDVRRISLTKLALGPETYSAALNSLEFGASWVSHDVCPEYREAVRSRIAGLDPQIANVFASSRSKLKPRTYSLVWGESYYLVWRHEAALNLPAALASKPLARIEDWLCALIVLPHDPDSEIETWIDEYCDLSIARAARDWAIVYPPPYTLGDDGDHYILAGDDVVIALKSTGVGPPGDLTCSDGRSSVVAELVGARQHFVVIHDNDKPKNGNFYLAWDGAYVATLAARPFPADSSDNAVAMFSDGPDGRTRAELHSSSGQALLSDLRRHRGSLFAVNAHPLLRGCLRHREPNATGWIELTLMFRPAAGALSRGRLSEELLRQVNSVLQNSALDVELDFGPFGFFAAAGEHRPALTEQPVVPAFLRARIEWLVRASGSYASERNRPTGTLCDQSLISHFEGLRVPTKLLAQQRAIHKQLRNLKRRGGRE